MQSLFRKLGKAGLAYDDKRQRDLAAAQAIYDGYFPQQARVERDPNDYIAVICPRRSGKSYFGGAYVVRTCLLKPYARCLIVGLSLNSTKQSFWGAIDRILRQQGLRQGHEVNVNRTDLSVEFENGSYLRLYGAETEDRIERIRGDEFDLVIIDEAKSFSPTTLEYLIHEVLDPAVGTREGKIVMVGTPGHVFAGEFYLATNPGLKRIVDGVELPKPVGSWYADETDVTGEALWSVHRWTQKDNIRVPCVEVNGETVPKQWLRNLRKKADKGWRDDHPTWRREMLGEWVVNENGLVFDLAALRYSDPARVLWLPDSNRPGNYGLPDGEWSFLLGIDFGYQNPTAFTVAAVSQNPQELREVHSEKHSQLVLSDVADIYNQLVGRFGGFEAVVVDAGAQGKMIQETLRSDYGIPAIPAEKQNKQAFIQAMNSDMHAGKVKVVEGSKLCEEMTMLAYDLSNGGKEELARKGSLREDPQMENDLCDSFLYVWRYSNHRWQADKEVEQVQPGTLEWWLQREQAAKQAAFDKKRTEQEAMWDAVFATEDPWQLRRAVYGAGIR